MTTKISQHRAASLARLDKRHVWHPFTQQAEWADRKPIIMESGKGVWLRDIHGRKFLDGNSSLWVNVWGHNHPVLNRAVEKQLKKIAHSTFLGLTHEPAIRLAKKLVEIAPQGLSRVFYSDNGSTAVEVALKMAYQYWQLTGHPKKTRFVSLKDGYHGDTIGSVSVGGVALFHERFKGLLFKGWQATPAGHRPRGRSRGSMDSRFRGNDIEDILLRHHHEIAAVVMEPLIQGASGMRVMPKGYLSHVRRLCNKYNVLLIVDEVATGFGRTGTMFACEQEGVTPDFLCVAKSLTGGYLPLAATLTKERIYRAFLGRYDEFKTFFHGHTYTANPLACAVALANLNYSTWNKLLANVRARTLQIQKIANRLANHPHIEEIRQVGLMVGIELVQQKIPPGPPLRKGGAGGFIPYAPGHRIGLKVCDAALKRGVWLRPLGDTIVLMPPLVISEKELGFLLKVVEEAIEEVTGPHPTLSHRERAYVSTATV